MQEEKRFVTAQFNLQPDFLIDISQYLVFAETRPAESQTCLSSPAD
jgi:hypothetical protein